MLSRKKNASGVPISERMYPNLLIDKTTRDLEVGPYLLELIHVYNAGFHQIEGGHAMDDEVARQHKDGAIAPAPATQPTLAVAPAPAATLVSVVALAFAAPPVLIVPLAPPAPAEIEQFPWPKRQSVWMEYREVL